MKYKHLSHFVNDLQAIGRYSFEKKEAAEGLGVSDIALKRSLQKLSKKGQINLMKRGFYIVVPPEYQVNGILPPSWFIHDLMKFIGRPYYVALLSAAAIFGAAHEQSQVFQVITDRPRRDINVSGLRISFFMKSGMEKTPIIKVKTETGFMDVSSPGATSIDLVRFSDRIGGLDRVVTVLQELSEAIKVRELLEAARCEKNLSFIQRLGFLLDRIGKSRLTRMLARWVNSYHPRFTPLNPKLPPKGHKHNSRWKIIENVLVEGEL